MSEVDPADAPPSLVTWLIRRRGSTELWRWGAWVISIYYAARSRAKLESVCEALAAAFVLPPFEFDSHDTWRYAWSEVRGLRLNITKARGYRTVETWMPGCPSGVNYQVILTTESEPPDFTSRLAKALGTAAVRFASSPATDA